MPDSQFNPPPGWPIHEGFTPPRDWQPDPSWPSAPPDWQFWLDDVRQTDDADELERRSRSRRGATRVLSYLVAAVLILGAGTALAIMWWPRAPSEANAVVVTCDQYAAKGFHERAQEQDKLLEQHGIDGIAAGDALIAQLTAVCGLDHALRPDGKAGRNGIVAIDAVVDWEQVKRATAQPRRDP